MNTVLELLCTIALTVAIVGVQNYLSTRQAWQLGAVVPLLSLAVLVGAAVIWSLPLSAKLVVPGLLILGLELLLWVDGPCAAAPAGAGQNEGKRSVSCRGDALAVVLCGTLGPRALFGARGYFWGAEPSGDMEKDGLCIFWTSEP